jgi:hypothetical protein
MPAHLPPVVEFEYAGVGQLRLPVKRDFHGPNPEHDRVKAVLSRRRRAAAIKAQDGLLLCVLVVAGQEGNIGLGVGMKRKRLRVARRR